MTEPEIDRRLRDWLAEREPGHVPPSLRANARAVPYETPLPMVAASRRARRSTGGTPAGWSPAVVILLLAGALVAATIASLLLTGAVRPAPEPVAPALGRVRRRPAGAHRGDAQRSRVRPSSATTRASSSRTSSVRSSRSWCRARLVTRGPKSSRDVRGGAGGTRRARPVLRRRRSPSVLDGLADAGGATALGIGAIDLSAGGAGSADFPDGATRSSSSTAAGRSRPCSSGRCRAATSWSNSESTGGGTMSPRTRWLLVVTSPACWPAAARRRRRRRRHRRRSTASRQRLVRRRARPPCRARAPPRRRRRPPRGPAAGQRARDPRPGAVRRRGARQPVLADGRAAAGCTARPTSTAPSSAWRSPSPTRRSRSWDHGDRRPRRRDRGRRVVEDTFDWYAQDATGNLWYLGEDTKEYEKGKVVEHGGLVGGRCRRRPAGDHPAGGSRGRHDLPAGVLRRPGRGRAP